MAPGSSRFIKAMTDAENDYLMRPRLRGKLETEKPEGWAISCTSLNNGIANFKIVAPETVKVGETLKLFIGFMDIEKVEPLGFEFMTKIVWKTKIPREKPEPPREPQKSELKVQLTRNMPKIIEVWENDANWDRFEMNEKSGFSVMSVPNSTAIEIYLNMSNLFLTQYLLKYKRASETEIIKKQYKIGMTLMACALWKKIKEKENKDEIIAFASAALSQVILSAIRRLGGISAQIESSIESEDSLN
jgi:hypothetical protein